jgi:hypothetical protein|eukprot:COSAG02_NODE_2401_length_8945_cov_4.251752_5_plen_104_part_00
MAMRATRLKVLVCKRHADISGLYVCLRAARRVTEALRKEEKALLEELADLNASEQRKDVRVRAEAKPALPPWPPLEDVTIDNATRSEPAPEPEPEPEPAFIEF